MIVITFRGYYKLLYEYYHFVRIINSFIIRLGRMIGRGCTM